MFKIALRSAQIGTLILCVLFIFSKLHRIYDIPLYRNFVSVSWDEPFATGAAINALHNKGDPKFYYYGGTSVYPAALVFWAYEKWTGHPVRYWMLNQERTDHTWPVTRRVYPPKPFYLLKIFAVCLFSLLELLFVMSFCFWTLPLSFFPSSLAVSGWLGGMNNFGEYYTAMLPELWIGTLSGLTTVTFLKTLFITQGKRSRRAWHFTLLTAVLASLMVATKISTIFVVLLPLTLAFSFPMTGKAGKKRLIQLFLALVLPYVLSNPALFIAPKAYWDFLIEIFGRAKGPESAWRGRWDQLFRWVDNLGYLLKFPNLLLVFMGVSSIALFAKRYFVPFMGFAGFYFASLVAVSNNSNDAGFFARHLSFLIIPTFVWFLFPLILFYQTRRPRVQQSIFIAFFALSTLVFPWQETYSGLLNLKTREFKRSWTDDTRDQFEAYVSQDPAMKVFFYDLHGFSMPQTIIPRFIGFLKSEEIPSPLPSKTSVAYIRYAGSELKAYDIEKAKLEARFKIIKVFGNPSGSANLHDRAPPPDENPTIVVLGEK